MITEAAFVTLSCVLFIQMGLSREIQERIGFKSEILSCPKCLTFWSVMALMLIKGNGVLYTVAASFIFAYLALWLALLYDVLAKFYNVCYDSITETPDTSTDAETSANESEIPADEVSQM